MTAAEADSFSSLITVLSQRGYFTDCGARDFPYKWDPVGVKAGRCSAFRAVLCYELCYRDEGVVSYVRGLPAGGRRFSHLADDAAVLEGAEELLAGWREEGVVPHEACLPRPSLACLAEDDVLPHDKVDLLLAALEEISLAARGLPAVEGSVVHLSRMAQHSEYSARRCKEAREKRAQVLHPKLHPLELVLADQVSKELIQGLQ